MKKFGARLLAAAVAGSLIVTPVMAAPSINDLKEDKAEKQSEVNSLQKELTDIMTKLGDLEEDLIKKGEEITQAEADLTVAEEKEKEQYEAMKLRIKYMYEEGDAGFFSTLVDAQSYSDLVNRAEYIQKVHDYDRKMLDKYVETKNEVAELKDNLEEGQAEMQALSDEMVVQKGNLETTLTQMRSQIEDFDSQLVQAKEAAAEELRHIEEEQRAAEAAEAAAREQAEREQAEREQQAAENARPSDDGQQGSQGISQPSDNPDDKKEDARPSDDGKEDSKGDGQDSKKEEDDGQEDSAASRPSNASLGQQIADMGCNYIGNKYVYGGTSLTNGIDCSGFVQQIHRKFGISTPRTSGAIRGSGKSVSYADRMPGDVICYSGHVAIYIGNNKIVHASNSAPYPRGGIKISSPANYRTVLAVRRYW